MLQGWRSVYVMQLLCFVDNSFDVGAFQESDLSNDYFPLFLFFSEIIVCNVSDGLKAAWKMNIIWVFGVILFGEPVQLLLIIKVFIV